MKKERLDEIKTAKEAKKAKLKEKPFSKLTAKEKGCLAGNGRQNAGVNLRGA